MNINTEIYLGREGRTAICDDTIETTRLILEAHANPNARKFTKEEEKLYGLPPTKGLEHYKI